MQRNQFKQWVNEEVAKQLDKDGFFSLPLKMRIGIFMMLGSFTIGYGVPIVTMIISVLNHHPASGLIKGSIAYAVSWVIGAVGLTLAGKDCIKYPIYFFAKLMKKVFPNYFLD